MKQSIDIQAAGPSSPRSHRSCKKFLRKDEGSTQQEELCDPKKFTIIGSCHIKEQWSSTTTNLCSTVPRDALIHEIYPEKLYLIHLNDDSGNSLCETNDNLPRSKFIFYRFENTELITYEPFNYDFGPFNISATHLFCSKIKIWLDTLEHRREKAIVVVIDGDSYQTKLNGTLLTSIAAMVLMNMTAQEVIKNLKYAIVHKCSPNRSKGPFINQGKRFSDVSRYFSTFRLKLEDCIEAFYHALKLKFYDYYQFDQVEYLFYELVRTGDLNWIVPGKILAFAGPSDKPISALTQKHKPSFYHDYFRDHNVTTIIRLNDAEYDKSGFTDAGFQHHDLIFPDGFPPTSTIAREFIEIVDAAEGAVAVHCYAGIGRTGTLIAAYLVVKYQFTPEQAIAWTRMCRPGSVIGQQQDWLLTYFERNDAKRMLQDLKHTDENGQSDQELPPDLKPTTDYAIVEREKGQAMALVLTKKKRKKSVSGPATRSTRLTRLSLEKSESTISKFNILAGDLTLDLGKTIPIQYYNKELIDAFARSKYPEFYVLNDGVYDWKVKFPRPDYVRLQVIELPLEEGNVSIEDELVEEPNICCIYVKSLNKRNKSVTKMEPVMYLKRKNDVP